MILRGYISSRPLNDNVSVDQSIQNMVIRNSCNKRGFTFLLSATEYGMKNCFLILNQVLQDLKKNKFQGVAFYSLLQLPKNYEDRKKIYNASVLKGKKIFFSSENILVAKESNLEKIEEIIRVQDCLKYCPKNFNTNRH